MQILISDGYGTAVEEKEYAFEVILMLINNYMYYETKPQLESNLGLHS